MLREYELTIIARADLPESEANKLQTKYEQLMTDGGGEIIQKNVWGTKRLAFPINKHFKGHYVNYDFVGQKDHINEVERLLRLDENILRFLTIRLGENVDVGQRRDELLKQAQKLREMKERDTNREMASDEGQGSRDRE